MGRVFNVAELRVVSAPGAPHPAYGYEGWMPLADAMAGGIGLSNVAAGIGPRVRGMVYRGGYLRGVNTVHDVFVCVAPAGPDSEDGRRILPRRAVWWEVAEESADDNGRIRRHMTSWQYEQRNEPLFMIGE
jgi:hypothetical protein